MKSIFLSAVLLLGFAIVAHAHEGMSHDDSSSAAEHDHDMLDHHMMDGSMSSRHMAMAAHMRMTERRAKTADDQKRADEVTQRLARSIEKYKDYRLAVADGYKPFLPDVQQPMYHFTKNWNAIKEAFRFDPAQPTSLLYKKSADGYELIGAMYTAPRRWPEDKLDRRIPLSVASWHQHVNVCLPQKGEGWKADWKKFGPAGSISTEMDCGAANGRFYPVIFGWMVHCYPFEESADKIWAH